MIEVILHLGLWFLLTNGILVVYIMIFGEGDYE